MCQEKISAIKNCQTKNTDPPAVNKGANKGSF